MLVTVESLAMKRQTDPQPLLLLQTSGISREFVSLKDAKHPPSAMNI